MAGRRRNLVDHIEAISEQIQILALNIAVAAAKMSFNKKLKPEGYFVTMAYFLGEGLHLSSTFAYHNLEIFTRMMDEHGFALKGQIIHRFGSTLIIPACTNLSIYSLTLFLCKPHFLAIWR